MTGGWLKAGVLAALAGVAALPGSARAQSPADIARLEALSQERGEALRQAAPNGVVRQMVPPRAVPEHLRQLRGLWVCSGAVEHQPVFTEPSYGAGVMGRTMPYVATTGDAVDGFVQVLHANGYRGWIPAAILQPFRAPGGTSAQCTVKGVRPNGAPVFDIR